MMTKKSNEQKVTNHQTLYVRQANILRKNIYEWDHMLRSSTGEDWPSMLGRLNAAMNQTNNLDRSIEEIMNHFVYEPRKCTANPQDIPFFLSVRLVDGNEEQKGEIESDCRNAFVVLNKYEKEAADLANQYEENMIRF